MKNHIKSICCEKVDITLPSRFLKVFVLLTNSKNEPQKRCTWVNLKNELYRQYHDNEWGVPVHNDKKLFEMLILEGAQAGLSWETVLKKRENYRKAFDDFDPEKIAKYGESKKAKLLQNESIIRNRLKIKSAIQNPSIFKNSKRI